MMEKHLGKPKKSFLETQSQRSLRRVKRIGSSSIFSGRLTFLVFSIKALANLHEFVAPTLWKQKKSILFVKQNFKLWNKVIKIDCKLCGGSDVSSSNI
jgi:hypothetical protein